MTDDDRRDSSPPAWAWMDSLRFDPPATPAREAALLAQLPPRPRPSRRRRVLWWCQWVGWEMIHALVDMTFYVAFYSRAIDDDGRRSWRGGQWHPRGGAWTVRHCCAVERARLRAGRSNLAGPPAGGDITPDE